MSILNSSYEISVWLDKLVNGTFQEERICVIGSDAMLFEGRAIEPRLTRNINGEKKFSFKMYKRFTDTITGEEVENPFSEYLINEAKVKLYYKDKWYDFYIKNVVENSSTYLYSYELADASVQELSKNGYGVTFDAKLMNNLGTAAELAATTLEDTDWAVESEVFVEKVVDNLVYAAFSNISSFSLPIYQIQDQTNLNEGVISVKIDPADMPNSQILAFYSSSKNKPHRFQFICLSNYNKDKVLLDQDNNIINPNCQYYIDIPTPQMEYEKSADYYLPQGIQVSPQTGANNDTTMSTWYKAKRYGFAQQTQYVPLLDKYCNIYKDSKGVEYYGYLNSEYTSPVLITNIITNAEFKGNTGWTGSYIGPVENQKNNVGAKVESVCGYFSNNNDSKLFLSAMDDLQNGSYDGKVKNRYSAYLKVEFPQQTDGCAGVLINSGFYDNRGTIAVPQDGDEWIVEAEIYNGEGVLQSLANFNFSLGEARYNTDTGGQLINDWTETVAVHEDEQGITGQFGILTFDAIPNNLTEASFKNKQVKLIIAPKEDYFNKTYYIKSIYLYKKYLNSLNNIIRPGDLEIEGIITTNYIFIPSTELVGANAKTKEEELIKTIVREENLNYSTFVPQYNVGAEKTRTITAKESNYFNILQTIAETFECWMDIIITRDEFGTHKTIKFKNFTGEDNYASFRYGVNLKDIQRTYESKQLATKLIVKQNNNQLAKNGFCTIARAGANPTGENYIYDFQYFHKTGLLDATKYLAEMYYYTNPLDNKVAIGPDVDEEYTGEAKDYNGTNLQNYFNRIKALNTKIEPINDDLVSLNLELLKLKADLAVQEGLVDAAASGAEEASDDFFNLVGFYPTELDPLTIQKVVCFDGTKYDNGEPPKNILPNAYGSVYNYEALNSKGFDFQKLTTNIQQHPLGPSSQSLQHRFEVSLAANDMFYDTELTDDQNGYEYIYAEEEACETTIYTKALGTSQTTKAFIIDAPYDGLSVVINDGKYQDGRRYKLSYTLDIPDRTRPLRTIGTHCASFKDLEYYIVDYNTREKTLIGKNRDYVSLPENISYPIDIEVQATYYENSQDRKEWKRLFIQPERGVYNESDGEIEVYFSGVTLEQSHNDTSNKPRTFYIQPIFGITPQSGETTYRSPKIAITIPPYSRTGSVDYTIEIADYSTKTCSKALQTFVTCEQERNVATVQVESLSEAISDKEEAIAAKQTELKRYSDQKTLLNKLFYSQYSRFIQEGTWMSEDYVDDNKYYNDSLSVLYNSCYPQVAYNINVVALNKLPGYENFDFDIGENTYVEDPEFLGKDTNGKDIRVRVAIAEMTENLDDPAQDNIKVQNFKNDFADLFHKITATVQQAQYNSGAYEKAVELAEADAELKSAFLHEGLQNMGDALSIAGQTTVIQDTSGITLTDSNTKNQMRLIGGAILMSVEDQETGERKWKTGLTPEGISASLIQAGTVNTGIINIMNATEPTFKWDSFGISAYDTDWTGGSANGRVDPSKFVRYDKYGLYGINSAATTNNVYIDGSSWHPSSMDEIRQVANFALTWDGLYLRLGNGTYTTDQGKNIYHNSQAMLGKVDNQIFNYWDSNGIPRYREGEDGPEFVKVFAIGSNIGGAYSEELVIYDDGTLTANNVKLTGSVEWTAASSPSKSIFSQKEIDKPVDGTYFNQIPETNADGWHRVYNREKDLFHCRTDDGGATWQGPIPLTGRSVTGSTIEYTQGQAGLRVEQIANLTGWQNTRPTQLLPNGYCVYTRVQDIYNFGDPSPYRYSADGMNGKDGEDTITCHIESSAGTAFEASATGTTTLTAYIYEGSAEMDLSNKEIYWYVEGQETSFASGNDVTVNIADIRGKTIYFEVDAGGDDTSVLALARVGKMILAKV